MDPIIPLSMRPALQQEKALQQERSLTRFMACHRTVHGIRKGKGLYRKSAVEDIVSFMRFPSGPSVQFYKKKTNISGL